ncbi:MAG: nucleotidyltransferase domain-containing protein [Clostridia bacterium]|jgi:hypothetical protein
MNIGFAEDEKTLTYIITDGDKYGEILKSQYYSQQNEQYTKSFPKTEIWDIQMLKQNYLKYAEKMFLQMGYFQHVPWQAALLKFIDCIEGHDISWWLTGSCALCIRGINVQPHDVDIMLDSRDLEKVRDIFSQYIVEPIVSSKGWVVRCFGVLFLEARIDLAFDPEEFVDIPHPADFGPYAMKNLEEVKWMGKTVLIPPLDLQLEVNRRRGRGDRVKAIEDFAAKISCSIK